MGVKDSLVSLMGDFVHLQRNPEFRSKQDLQNEFQFNPVNRRHSVQITCGTQEEKPPIHQRTFSAQLNNQTNNHRRQRSEALMKTNSNNFEERRQKQQRRVSEPFIFVPNNFGNNFGNERKRRSPIKCQSFDCSFSTEQQQLDDTNNLNNLHSNSDSYSLEGRLTPSSLSKSATFSKLFSQQLPIEEVEEYETDMDGQRRQSTARRPQIEQMHYGTIIRL
uniref:Uncharacterized protein n=1 Tax=Meloidogyne enterolobii TaxID=390850 RepID=A0A6V7WDR7_MELEN|nr:unnamed protein product [Meloidogyne enterolobii]